MPDPLYSIPAGTDGRTPIQSAGLQRLWWMNNIYLGQEGANKHIPGLKDLVFNPETLALYIVDHIDEVTFVPDMRLINFNGLGTLLTQQDVIFGVGPGTRGDDYRAYLDKSVYPYVLAIDDRLFFPGSDAQYAKIFRSTDTELAISKVFNNTGVFQSVNVPLEVVAITGHTNYHIKTVPPCKITEDLISGDVITVIVYSSSGHVIKIRQCIIEETTSIRDHNTTGRRITNIELESSFMSQTENNLIIYPLNVPINALNLTGVVTYNDGVVRMPVDGTKFILHGLEQVAANMPEEVEMVLQYRLSPGEVSVSPGGVLSNTINKPIRLRVAPSSWSTHSNGYAVKLFCLPYWNPSLARYQLSWYLFDIDRSTYFDVSTLVSLSSETGSFNGNDYGNLQRKKVTIRLSDVSASFNSFTHVQLVDISLFGPPNVSGTPWSVKHTTNGAEYGSGLVATLEPSSMFRVSSGIASQSEWLDRVYRNSQPLHNPSIETSAPDPTHFVVMYGSSSATYPISAWDAALPRLTGMTQYQNVYIRFVRTFGGSEFLELSMSAMVLKNA